MNTLIFETERAAPMWHAATAQGLRQGYPKACKTGKSEDLLTDAQVEVQAWKHRGGRSWLHLKRQGWERLEAEQGLSYFSKFLTAAGENKKATQNLFESVSNQSFMLC